MFKCFIYIVFFFNISILHADSGFVGVKLYCRLICDDELSLPDNSSIQKNKNTKEKREVLIIDAELSGITVKDMFSLVYHYRNNISEWLSENMVNDEIMISIAATCEKKYILRDEQAILILMDSLKEKPIKRIIIYVGEDEKRKTFDSFTYKGFNIEKCASPIESEDFIRTKEYVLKYKEDMRKLEYIEKNALFFKQDGFYMDDIIYKYDNFSVITKRLQNNSEKNLHIVISKYRDNKSYLEEIANKAFALGFRKVLFYQSSNISSKIHLICEFENNGAK